jgi:DNA-binding MurR/RpiR family transcriptional regulator
LKDSKQTSRLTPKQEKAIAALLSEPTMRAAAAACGMSETTLWRMLQDLDFQECYRRARGQSVQNAISRLQKASARAVDVLLQNLEAESPGAQIRAAELILKFALEATELSDLIARVERLESFQNGGKQWG